MIHLALPPFLLGWSLECPVWVTGHMERHIIHIIHSFGVKFFACFPGKPRVFWKDQSSEGVFLVRKIRVFLFLHRKKNVSLKRAVTFGRPFFVDDFGARKGQSRDGQLTCHSSKNMIGQDLFWFWCLQNDHDLVRLGQLGVPGPAR